MKIISLTAENVKRLKAVSIKADGGSVIISGKNDQGKSSILDSIMYALGGKAACPENPIRHGEKTAEVKVDLEDLLVTRKWTESGSYLEVANAEGAPYRSPQAVLDGLVGRLSFDPMAFASMRPVERREALLGCVDIGLDLGKHDAERAAWYDRRRDINRDLKQAQAELRGLDKPEGNPEEVSIEDANKALIEENDKWTRAKRLESGRDQIVERARSIEIHIGAMRGEIADAEAELATLIKKAAEIEIGLKTIPAPDVEGAVSKLAGLEKHNHMARAAKEYRKKEMQAEHLRDQHEAANDKIEAFDRAKEAALLAADMPVPGLGLSDDDITLDGVPFVQLSTSSKLRLSMAIAMRMNPKLRVIRIVDGNDLDPENLRSIIETANGADYQLWIERIDKDGLPGVVIEDGEVAEQAE